MIQEFSIPVDAPCYTLDVELDGVPFTLRFDYSGKVDRFLLSLYDQAGTLVRAGIKVLSGWNILRLCHTANRPAGVLIFGDPAGGGPPGLRDLGRRVRLFYLPLTGT